MRCGLLPWVLLASVACSSVHEGSAPGVTMEGEPCATDQDCDDGLVCSGLERCIDGRCWSGRPPVCDDGDPCTVDLCLEPVGCTSRALVTAPDASAAESVTCSPVANDNDADGGFHSGYVPRFPDYCEGSTMLGDVVASSQATLDALESVRCLDGDLVVMGAEIRDLSALSALRFLGGGLTIRNAGELEELRGLDALEVIEGSLTLASVKASAYLAPFPSLTRVRGSVLVEKLAETRKLAGFAALERVDGGLTISDLPQLRDLSSAFTRLRTVDGAFVLSKLPELKVLRGFAQLTRVRHDLRIEAPLASLRAFEALESVGYSLELPTTLTELGEFPALTGVGQLTLQLPLLSQYKGFNRLRRASSLWVSGKQLRQLDAFRELEDAYGVKLHSLPELSAVYGFGKLRRLSEVSLQGTRLRAWPFPALRSTDSLSLADNVALSDVASLATLEEVRDISVRNNSALGSLAPLKGSAELYALEITENVGLTELGLSSVEKIRGKFRVFANPKLSRCQVDRLQAVYTGQQAATVCCNRGCETCEGVACALEGSPFAGQSTYLEQLYAVTNFGAYVNLQSVHHVTLRELEGPGEPMPNLKRVLGSVYVVLNAYVDLRMLAAVEEVQGSVDIISNHALRTLGLEALERVGGKLSISNNSELEELGLPALEEVGGGGSVSSNPRLSTCQVQALEEQIGQRINHNGLVCDGTCEEGVCR